MTPVRHRQLSVATTALLALALTGVLSASAAAATCTDEFTGPNEGQWSVPANWSTGKRPTPTDVACWPTEITVLATEPENFGGGEVGSMQGGSLKVGKRNGFFIFGPSDSILSGSLTLEEQSDMKAFNGTFGFHVDGAIIDSPGKLEGEKGGMAITQGPGSTLTIGGTSQVEVHPGSSMTTESPITIANPEFNTSGPITTTSTITLAEGLTIDHQGGGNHATFTAAGITANAGPTYGFGGDALHLTGGTTTVAPGTTLESGPLYLEGGVLNDEGTIGTSTNEFDETALAPVTLSGGSFSGAGTVAEGLNVKGGTVAPGPHGKLTVAGSYTQEGGTLAFGLSGPVPGSGFDQLLIDGSATLDGTLSVADEDAFTPTFGNTFKIISGASSREGTFASVSGPSAGLYGVEYNPDGATLTTNPLPAAKNETPAAATDNGASTSTSSTATSVGVATSPKAVEELLNGCSGSPLVLNDVYIRGSRVEIRGSATKSYAGKKVKILFNEGKQVATATVETDGQYTTTAPLPSAKIRDNLDTRYTAEIGKLRSLHLKLVRRLLLEPPKASGTTVTLTGQVTLPLTKPIAPVTVEQQLECGKTTVAKTFIPPTSGRFHITLTVPANAKAVIFRLTSKVAANKHSVTHGFTTFSLPLPIALR
jgi:hypothetical protein